MCAALHRLGREWAVDPARPTIAPVILRNWERLIEDWLVDERLPLLVRKSRGNRGSVVSSSFGRQLVPTDNSPAQWAFAVAFDGICPGVSEVMDLLIRGRLPIAMALSAGAEKAEAMYRGLVGRCPNTSTVGWKLAHVLPVGLGGRGSLDRYDRAEIERHFRRLMSPDNMFLVPAAWAGLAEVGEFVDGFRTALAELPLKAAARG
jgi:hypothetical protein